MLFRSTELDKQINALWREHDAIKAKGADKVKGGDYDRVLYKLRDLCRERAAVFTVTIPE